MKAGQKSKAVFLDRDGTINVEKNYLYRPEDLEFIPGAPAAIRSLNAAGYKTIVISNQSGIARGLYTRADVERLHAFMQERVSHDNARIDAFFYCPHHPAGSIPELTKTCDCRKPKPGLIGQAMDSIAIDLWSSYLIGDHAVDIELGIQQGLHTILVRTGHGRETESKCSSFRPHFVSDSIVEAVNYIITRDRV